MDQSLRRKLDRITAILWAGGVTNPVTYIEQISYLIYLKLLDEEEAARELKGRLGAGGNGEGLFPLQAERYRWSKWRFKSGAALRDFVRDEVFAYMASLVKDEPKVAQYFRDAVLEITDPNVLKQVVDELDSIEFRRLGPDVKGDVFEYLLTHLGQSALNGQFRTPRQIRAFMVEMVDPDLGDTLYDPACGTAGFLIDAVDHIFARYSETRRKCRSTARTGWRSAARPSKRPGRRSRTSRPTGRAWARRSPTGAGSKPRSTVPTYRAR